MKLFYEKELNDLCLPYIKELKGRLKHKEGMDKDMAQMIAECAKFMDDDSRNNSKFEPMLTKYIEEHGIEDAADIFNGELRQIPEFFLGEEWTELFCTAMKLMAQWPYSKHYYRRSQRSRKATLHVMDVACSLWAFVQMRATGLSDSEMLNNRKLLSESWLAAKLYTGDQTCVDYVREAMTSENNSKRMTHEHFHAIVKSGHKELLELEGKLLLAARLQEGLRQAIVETCDDGLPESYIYMLKVIKDNNLQRFAAVKRGFAVTTGMTDSETPDRINNKLLELVYLYITDQQEAQKAIESDDAMQVYLGLWAIGFHETEKMAESIMRLIDSAPAYKVEAALMMASNTDNPKLKREAATKALSKRSDELGIVAGVLPLCYSYDYFSYSHIAVYMGKCYNSKEDAEHDFNQLAEVFAKMDKSKTFNPYVFPWHSKELKRSEVADMLCRIAIFVNTPDIVDRALEYFPSLESFTRYYMVDEMFNKPTTRKQVAFLVEMMTNASSDTRGKACKIVERLFKENKLTADDFRAMEEHLRLKSSEMRMAIVRMFGKLPSQEATDTVRRLLTDKVALRRLAGLEIMKNWNEKHERPDAVQALLADVERIARPSQQEKILIDTIYGTNTAGETGTRSNGFGLYNPDDCLQAVVTPSPDFDVEKALMFDDPQTAVDMMKKLMKVIEENADREFTSTDGDKIRLGNRVRFDYFSELKRGEALNNFAYPELWIEFYEKEVKTTENLLKLQVAIIPNDNRFQNAQKKFLGKAFNHGIMKPVCQQEYYNLAVGVVIGLFYQYADEKVCEVAVNLLSEIAAKATPKELVAKSKYGYGSGYNRRSAFYNYDALYEVGIIDVLSRLVSRNWEVLPDDLFKRGFHARYELFHKIRRVGNVDMKEVVFPINSMEFTRAYRLGLLTDGQLLQELLGWVYSDTLIERWTETLGESRKTQTYRRRTTDNVELSDDEKRLLNTAVSKIIDIELKRGDMETEVSTLADNIKYVSGADYFIRILTAMGKDMPVKYASCLLSKRQVFSGLLAASVPGEDDTPERLKKLAKQAKISDERLAEAAIYATAWLDMVEQAIKWKGLASSTYYFLAHTAERLNDRQKSHISRYTAVEPDDFADGAFDPDWFSEVYGQLGKKRFETVYAAAKYMSEGNRHARARKLSDAALGIYKVKPLMKEIKEKRNKDLVVALGLVPLGRNRMADITQRYDFLNKFLKESKQYGAQRQASENRAVQLALDNLARNAGYGDSTRLVWSMEAQMLKQVAEYLEPKEVDGVTLYVAIDDGVPELVVESKGKRLQSLPTRLKKDKYAEQAKEVYRQLKEQHTRGRALLERAMVEAAAFTGEEIAQLKDNPVIWRMLSKLVLMKEGGTALGFPGDDGKTLVSAQGEICAIAADDRLRIAHCHDLYTAGVWSEYQQLLFEKAWRQPFKQVFRELYLATADEREGARSMRYSGNQIMPMRAAGMLKKRQWTVDYDNGLQKVSFNGNVTAVMYAMADWFSPSDIEAPTLEYVAFYDRRTMQEKKIAEVDALVFSEIMRDVDLAVSVAHAGGVDPEASHSTMEMRRVIVEHSLRMFGIGNVEVVGNFAKIKGSLADYNIHLGSGVIHKDGGAQIAVLPVHSQSRGRIFLPFLDEDPKTSEIISKILLFAEDTKIKDPMILEQLD